MTDRSADKQRAIFLPFVAALMLWNSVNADAALNKWIASVAALFFSGAAGWFWAKLHAARPSKLTER